MSKTKTPRKIKITTKELIPTSNIQTLNDREECPPEEYTDVRNIKIFIKQIENIEHAFSVSEIFVEVKHFDVTIGESEKIVLTDKQLCPIEYEINVPYNIADSKSYDKLISSPFYFTVWQSPGAYNGETYIVLSDSSEEGLSFDKLQRKTSLYEAILGVKLQEPSKDTVVSGGGDNKTEKVKGSSKTSKKSLTKMASSDKKKSNEGSAILKKKPNKKSAEKVSKTNSTKTKNEKNQTGDENDERPFLVGSCNVDLLPFFLGETEFEDILPVHQEKIHMDDNIHPFQELPRLTINISVDKPLIDTTENLSNILNFTVESMYNLPEQFSADIDYKIATVFPYRNMMLPFALGNGSFTEMTANATKFKIWPDLAQINNFSSCSKYRLDEQVSSIKNKTNINIKSALESMNPYIQWNLLRRKWLDEEANEVFRRKLARYRCWPLEIYLIPKDAKAKTEIPEPKQKKTSKQSVKSKSKSSSSGSSKSSTASKVSKVSAKNRLNEPLHLMSFVDISTLLYPGVVKSRVACEVKLFQLRELIEETGIEESYFYVKEEPVAKPEPKGKTNVGKTETVRSKTKNKEGSSKKGDKNKEKQKEPTTKEKQEVIQEVVEEIIVPSEKLKNSKGESTFIIIEVELIKPLIMKKPLEDLTKELLQMLPSRPDIPKSVMSFNLALADYRDCIKTLAHEINKEFQKYDSTENNEEIEYPKPLNFIRYLQSNGTYQKYTTTLMKSIPTLINERYHFVEDPKNTLLYERFISKAYVYLIDEMNIQVNSIVGCTDDHRIVSPIVEIDYLFCAKEAEELEATLLAERYYLQALSKDTRNPDVYFNYAVYLVGCKNLDKAFEYLKESLALKNDHKYSLLLFAILLFEREDYYTSETIFMTLIQYHSKFIEGWTCLYLFYKSKSNITGCDVCLEKIVELNKCEEDRKNDFIYNNDGLAWTAMLCPMKNPWFKTAITLIKLRALNYADLSLGCETLRESGIYRYYQGVVLYFLKDYEHALAHLLVAQKLHGSDYAVNSLIGHCYYRLGQYEEMKESYECIVYSYNHPEDMHMVYMNLALFYENDKQLEMARKYLLHISKLSPTPYSWLSLGIIFYKENNFLYAEACLHESNTLDNNLPETWAYLILVNLKIGKTFLATQCYKQLKRHKMNNTALLSLVEKAMENQMKIKQN